MIYYIKKMTPEEVEAERERRAQNCARIKFITIKIPAILAMLFILWMFIAGVGIPAIIVAAVIGTPWCLFWNWIANMELE